MESLFDRVRKSARYIKKQVKMKKPTYGLVLGSGLGGLADRISIKGRIPYSDIEGFPVSTVEGIHAGNLILGELGGKRIVAMEGRVHYYEGYTMKEVTYPVRVMKALGAKSLILTSAVGGMNPQFEPGDLIVITDHINLMGDNPLIGPNDERLGPRFPDMSQPYNRNYITRIEKVALDLGIPLKRGVLAAVAGPNLETAAEYRFMRRIGADIVGMSMVPENIAAVHAGMKVLGVSVVTDEALPDCLEPADIKEIIKVARKGEKKLCRLMIEFLKRL
ncbi:MAG: purine-nucleoside phosphorylase [Candidatus Latescibacteria bacterium]|nr:purine-nucleoside phosphorylase [bacterium]MBD3424903.1 purine-nucleoside phosphorylase [Candidatus Latescibacterota bacterium]